MALGEARAGGGSQQGSPAGAPGVAVLLGPLKELLEAATLQQEAMREIVAAVGDADRGKQGALNALLQQRQTARVGREEGERLRAEVVELREQNARLRERLRAAEAAGGGGAPGAGAARKPTGSSLDEGA